MTLDLIIGSIFAVTLIVRLMEGFNILPPSADWVVLEPLRRWLLRGHAEDCALNDAPSDRPWPCDCKPRWHRPMLASWVLGEIQRRAYREGRA